MIFDNNSFSSPGNVVTLDVDGFCSNMDWSGVTNNPSMALNSNLTVTGSIALSNSMNLLGATSETITFSAIGTTNSILSSGLTFPGNVTFDASSEWAFLDDFSVTGDLTLENGVINTQNHSVSAAIIQGSSTGSSTLNLGTSQVSVSSWNALEINNLSATGSIILISGLTGPTINEFSVFNYGTAILSGPDHTLNGTASFITPSTLFL